MIDGRNTLTTIVQSSTVELFRAFDIAIPPMSGSLALFIPHEVYGLARHLAQRPYEPKDWTRELCNQLLGRVKNRLHGCDIDLRTGLPTSVTGTLLDRHRAGGKPPEAFYGFRTLRGEITISLA